MGTAIGNALPFAVGVALSPTSIVAVILMLFSKSAKRAGPAFAVGWMLGIAIIGGIILLLTDPAKFANDKNGPSTTASVIQLILGALLLLVGARDWRNRPEEGDSPKRQRWMTEIDSFSPLKAFGLALFLSSVNPKNLLLAFGGALAIAQAGLSARGNVVAFAIFVLIASVCVIVPVAWYLTAPEKAGTALRSWRDWLEQNTATVMSVLFLIFGVILIGKGIAGLAS